MTRGLIAILERLCRAGAVFGALALLLLFLLGLVEILMRALFSSSLGFALEYGGYLLALSLMLGAGAALIDGAHIRFSLGGELLPKRLTLSLDLAASLIGLLIAAFLSFALIDQALGSWALDARSYFPSATPLVWPQALLAVGPLLLSLAFLARILRLLAGYEARS